MTWLSNSPEEPGDLTHLALILFWDLSTVLRAFRGPPFESLQAAGLWPLSLKTALLLALSSVNIKALSVSAPCLEFGPDDCKVVLKP